MCIGKTTEVIIEGKSISVDSCIADEVSELNRVGIKTLGCCCGHGKYEKTIIIKGHKIPNWEWFSGKLIMRKRNFYYKDKEGIFHLLEVPEKRRKRK
jgi:hypothetical protein